MLRITCTKKEPASALKKKQKTLSDAINIEMKRLEDLKKVEKENTVMIAKQKKMIVKNETEIKKVEEQLKTKLKVLLDINDEISTKEVKLKATILAIDKTQQSIDDKILTFEKEIKEATKKEGEMIGRLTAEVSILQENLKTYEKERDEILQQNQQVSTEIVTKSEYITKLEEEIESTENELSILTKDINVLEKEKVDLKALKREQIEIEQTIEQSRESLKELRRRMMGINKIREEKMKDLDDRDEKLIRKEDRVKNRANFIEDKAEEIDKKAHTLQKHFDKHKIPITVI